MVVNLMLTSAFRSLPFLLTLTVHLISTALAIASCPSLDYEPRIPLDYVAW